MVAVLWCSGSDCDGVVALIVVVVVWRSGSDCGGVELLPTLKQD